MSRNLGDERFDGERWRINCNPYVMRTIGRLIQIPLREAMAVLP